jgi:tripartite-type tricarboxylate transporter receptor subunit TctC
MQLASSALALALIVLLPAPAPAQTYPSRTVSVIVPFPAGGSVDGVARILVAKLNETVGQHFIVENRAGGASGTVGANAVAKAAPDGYTLLLSASVHVINPFLYKNVPYDVVNDFTPVSLLADGPLLVSTTPSVRRTISRSSSASSARSRRNTPSAPPAWGPPAIWRSS